MANKDKENRYLKGMVLALSVISLGLFANQAGVGISGQGVGGEEQVGCGGDMSGYAMGEAELQDPESWQVDSPDDARASTLARTITSP